MQSIYYELNLHDFVNIDISGHEFVLGDKNGNRVIIRATERTFNTIKNALDQLVEKIALHDWRRADGTYLFVCEKCRKVSLGRDVTRCTPTVYSL